MVTHVVFWKLKPEVNAQEAYEGIKVRLEELLGVVPGLCSVKVGRGFQGWDVALISEHESRAALEVYQDHPAHLSVKAFVHSVACERTSCDFEQ